MSYILAALEKADKERRKKRGLTFDSLSDQQGEPVISSAHSKTIFKIFGWGLGAVLIGGVFWYLFLKQSDDMQARILAEPPAAQQIRETPLAEPASRATVSIPATPDLPSRLEVEGIVYIEDQPSRSRVFIEGQGYREGDYYQEDFRILSISETEIRLSNGSDTRSYPIP